MRFSFLKNVGNQIILVVLVSIIFLTTFFIVYSYQQQVNSSKKQIFEKLIAIARSSSLLIDAKLHEDLQNKYLYKDEITKNNQDSAYLQLHDFLAEIKRVNKIESPIYTLVFDSVRHQFEFIATSSEKPYFRHSYIKFPKDLLEDHSDGGVLDEYVTENGRWLSAYAPIKSADGRTIAILQIDEKFNSFVKKANEHLIRNISIALVSIFLLNYLLMRLMKFLLEKQERMKSLLVDKNKEILNINEEIKTQHEKIIFQNKKISDSNSELEESKKLIEEKNALLENANKQLDEKVKVRTRELEQAVQNLDDFLYRSYHDILGPIATLQGLCQLSSLEIRDELSIGYFDKMSNSVENLRQAVRRINVVYEIKNRFFSTEKVVLRQMINEVIKKQHYLLQSKSSYFNNKISTDFAIFTDSFFLELFLSDIFRNAIRLTTADNVSKSEFMIAAKKKNTNDISIKIIDHGRNEIFFRSYFQYQQKEAININHELYVFHSALKKLNCKIINHNQRIGQVIEIIIPSHQNTKEK